ncbi:MAG TPA: hypothetical protein VK325_01985, partial [Pseudoxanthomonas sp.]|nr:hypothetical protein [Pseudoxanthomonas sp.]
MARGIALLSGLLSLALGIVACQPRQEPATAAPSQEQEQKQIPSLASSSKAPQTPADVLVNSARRRIPLRETY